MNKTQNTHAFSIVLALWLTLLLSFTGLYLLEYMIPFSRNVKWVENASKAFYESYAGIEDALYDASQNEIWYINSDSFAGYDYDIDAMGTSLPKAGDGDSWYDADRNQISQEKPIQILIWRSRLTWGFWSDRIRMSLRIPDLDRDSTFDESFDTSPDDDIIFWQLASQWDVLSASGTLIDESDINGVLENADGDPYEFWLQNGVRLDESSQQFRNFYNANCVWTNECVLKIAVIHPLEWSVSNTSIPYLEYQILTDASIPLRFAQIESDGSSFGFTKKLKVAVPQRTTNAAFDFTVFQ